MGYLAHSRPTRKCRAGLIVYSWSVMFPAATTAADILRGGDVVVVVVAAEVYRTIKAAAGASPAGYQPFDTTQRPTNF